MTIRVVVVDDSDIARSLLKRALEAEGDIDVVGEAFDGRQALERIASLAPDLATVDLSMPGMDGLEVISHVMASCPLPILVLTSRVSNDPSAGRDDELVLEAVRRGALEVAAKPGPAQHPDLRRKVRRLAAMPVVRHIRQTTHAPVSGAPVIRPRGRIGTGRRHLVALAASAGGPGALTRILATLPADLDACVLVVQHLPTGYAERFARELNERCALDVRCASPRDRAEAGQVILAPDDRHLVVVAPGRLATTEELPVLGHRPSADVLFRSIARVLGPDAVGVVLSGMGADGARGLDDMRAAGALTIAQDEATSAVYGMPRAARELGAAQRVLALDAIAPAIIDAVVRHGARRP